MSRRGLEQAVTAERTRTPANGPGGRRDRNGHEASRAGRERTRADAERTLGLLRSGAERGVYARLAGWSQQAADWLRQVGQLG
jgi:hypothetical protein